MDERAGSIHPAVTVFYFETNGRALTLLKE